MSGAEREDGLNQLLGLRPHQALSDLALTPGTQAVVREPGGLHSCPAHPDQAELAGPHRVRQCGQHHACAEGREKTLQIVQE